MAEALRRKFIIVSISAVIVVIFAIGLFSNLSNYYQIRKNADDLLTVLTVHNGYFPRQDLDENKNVLPPRMSPEAPFSTRFFTVKVDSQQNIIAVDTGKISATSEYEALNYANKVLESAKKSGFTNHYKYLVSAKEYGSLLVFVDVSRELDLFYSFLWNSLLIGFIAIVSVFLIVLFFSKKAIAPIVEAHEKQKQFITDAGHELKTPLSIINTNTDVLEMNHGENQWTKSIHKQIGRLSTLVESLIALTRMDENKKLINKKEFSLSELVSNAVGEFQDLSANYHRKMSIHIQDSILYYGDEDLIRKLLFILMDNALKYSPDGSSISIELKKHNNKTILETVNQAEHLHIGNYDVLFERFYRADTSRNSNLGGYGIGLSLAKSIAEEHKAKISAKSPDGQSLVIRIEL